SSEQVLDLVCLEAPSEIPRVAVISAINQSPFWMERAWRNELGKEVVVKAFSVPDLLKSNWPNLIHRTKHGEIPLELQAVYRKEASAGSWSWYVRI
ncbi:MAG: hypothetical protein ACI9QL_004220, partial [Candidatus Omnitrophota bacterium]